MNRFLAALLMGLVPLACTQPPTDQEKLELERDLRSYGYRVVKILDGETLLLDLNDRGLEVPVHLIGVDSPQYRREFKEGGGHDAGKYLDELLFGGGPGKTGRRKKENVYVRLGFEGWKFGAPTDPETLRPVRRASAYPMGAVINEDHEIEAYVYLEGHLINRLMIDSGLTRVDTDARFSRKKEFLRAQERARRLRLGLWRWSTIEK